MSAIFETDRLVARPLSLDDEQACLAIYGDPEVTRYVTSDGAPMSLDVVRYLLTAGMLAPGDDSRFGFWGLQRREDGRVIGTVALIEVEDMPGEYETGWHLARDAWGMGYAFESGVALLRHGFQAAGLERVHALARIENTRSIDACLRIGMQRGDDRLYQGALHACFVAERTGWPGPA